MTGITISGLNQAIYSAEHIILLYATLQSYLLL